MKFKTVALIVSLFFFTHCSSDERNPNIQNSLKPQYADSVIAFSSEYGKSPDGYSASQSLGAPDVFPEYGDKAKAWASADPDGQREFLVLGFDTVQTVLKIDVYETYNTGSIDTIYLRNASTQRWNKVWSGDAQTIAAKVARKFSVDLPETNYKADAIRIAVNSPLVKGYNEIDAVSIYGKP